MASLELDSTEIDEKKSLFDTAEDTAYHTWKQAVITEEEANREADKILAEAREKAEALRSSRKQESEAVKDQAINDYVKAHDEYRVAYNSFKASNSLNDDLLSVLGYKNAGKSSLSAKTVDKDFRAKYRGETQVYSEPETEKDTTSDDSNDADNIDSGSDAESDHRDDSVSEESSGGNGASPAFWKRNNR